MSWKALAAAAAYGFSFVMITVGLTLFYGSDPMKEYRDISEMVIGSVMLFIGVTIIWLPVTIFQYRKN